MRWSARCGAWASHNAATSELFRSPGWRALVSMAPAGRRQGLFVLRDLVHRAVAALRGRQPAALGRDRAALHAVRRVHDQLDLAIGPPTRVLRDLVDAGGAHVRPRLRDLAR